MEATSTNQLFRIIEVGSRLALSRSSVYREIEAGNLHALRIGKSLRISSEELDRYIAVLNEQSSQIA
jgi:excisionase family DNA binding protein